MRRFCLLSQHGVRAAGQQLGHSEALRFGHRKHVIHLVVQLHHLGARGRRAPRTMVISLQQQKTLIPSGISGDISPSLIQTHKIQTQIVMRDVPNQFQKGYPTFSSNNKVKKNVSLNIIYHNVTSTLKWGWEPTG